MRRTSKFYHFVCAIFAFLRHSVYDIQCISQWPVRLQFYYLKVKKQIFKRNIFTFVLSFIEQRVAVTLYKLIDTLTKLLKHNKPIGINPLYNVKSKYLLFKERETTYPRFWYAKFLPKETFETRRLSRQFSFLCDCGSIDKRHCLKYSTRNSE